MSHPVVGAALPCSPPCPSPLLLTDVIRACLWHTLYFLSRIYPLSASSSPSHVDFSTHLPVSCICASLHAVSHGLSGLLHWRGTYHFYQRRTIRVAT